MSDERMDKAIARLNKSLGVGSGNTLTEEEALESMKLQSRWMRHRRSWILADMDVRNACATFAGSATHELPPEYPEQLRRLDYEIEALRVAIPLLQEAIDHRTACKQEEKK